MPTNTNNKKEANEIFLSIYKNCDDALLFWRTKVNNEWDRPIENCIGFSIERQRKDKHGNWLKTEMLRNRVGFADNIETVAENENAFISKPSNIWPFQRYDWTDHGANNGETVRYRIIALSIPLAGNLGDIELPEIVDSGWTEAIEITADCDNAKYAAFFNRGTVMSQYVSRIMRENKWSIPDLKIHIKDFEEPLRRFLSGELRKVMLAILDEVIENPFLEYYAALYELSDVELIAKLKLLKGRGHIVLANGSDKTGDGNQDAREKLAEAGVDVKDRLLASKGLGHNKFGVVVNTSKNKTIKCWTGSTNWSTSGLCTQLNNGLLINDPEVAQLYLDQWNRLAEAGSTFPKELIDANAESPLTKNDVDVWFTRIRNTSTKNIGLGNDLQSLIDLVNDAKESILYVMFQPGPEPLTSILQRANEINVKGVVSTVTPNNIEKFKLKSIDIDNKEYESAIIQPNGIENDFSGWIKEITRTEFLFPNQNPGVGHAITHAKMIVIDAHSENCKIITGSHNFSNAASEKNDENFVVIHNAKELAEAYAVACTSIYEHYRWRAYVKDKFFAGQKPWSHLSSDTKWQNNYLNDNLKSQLALWVK
jgi:phosphatidylserine/phosphatidylglycerophosphate/cardiolipin synthase-like enzyme